MAGRPRVQSHDPAPQRGQPLESSQSPETRTGKRLGMRDQGSGVFLWIPWFTSLPQVQGQS